MKLSSQQNGTIQVASNCIGSGGEGKVYPVVSTGKLNGHVVKIYDKKNQTKERREKLEYMIQNTPRLQNNYSVMWPKDVVYENGKFNGYLMSQAQGVPLNRFLRFKLPKEVNAEYSKYELSASTSMEERLKVVYNLSAAISQVHATGNFVFGDLKPPNIILNNNSTTSIIDTDSIQISNGGQLLYPSPVATAEYLPPEAFSNNKNYVPETFDRFAMAVIFYWFLNGQHPSNGTYKKPFDKGETGLTYGIKNGLFACVDSKQAFFDNTTSSYKFHKMFYQLPGEVQKLFVKCFEAGTTNPDIRPTAKEWCSTVYNILKNHTGNVQVPLFPKMVVHNGKTTIVEPPEIRSFKGNKRILLEGDTIELSWTASTYDKIQLNYGYKTVDVTGQSSIKLKPKKNTTYNLIAENQHEKVMKSYSVQVSPRPAIRALKLTKNKVLIGEKVLIQWDAINAQKLILEAEGRSLDVTGKSSISLTVMKDVEFKLTALRSNPQYQTIKTVSVNAYSPISIDAFNISSKKIANGDSVWISWAVSGAEKIKLKPLGYVSSKGKKEISPSKSTSYELIATNPVMRKVTIGEVSVVPRPEVKDFQTSDTYILKGNSIRLKWRVDNAQSVFLSNGDRKWQVFNSEQILHPSRNTTYKLEVHSEDSIKVVESKVHVEVFGKVKIVKFVAEDEVPATVSGLPIKLKVSTLGATKVMLKGNGRTAEITGKKHVYVKPEKSCTYKLIASNPCIKNEQELKIEVIEIPEMDKGKIFLPGFSDRLLRVLTKANDFKFFK